MTLEELKVKFDNKEKLELNIGEETVEVKNSPSLAHFPKQLAKLRLNFTLLLVKQQSYTI